MIVTDITPLDKKRSKIFLDEEFAFVLYNGELKTFQIEINQAIGEVQYQTILCEVLPKRARERALYYLRAQNRTEAEVKGKLLEGGYPPDICEDVVAFLKEYHYVDDVSYATHYIEYHKKTKSQKKICYELLQKGIVSDVIKSLFEENPCDEEQQIKKWLEKKRIVPANLDACERQKAMQALARQGFSWDRIRRVFCL